ncbi:30S ribosomal protein S13 [candidate division WWE3 bacterium RIFOXYC1_FULL_39_7]|uniref:Small ribosomal subunit protein uS13 n=2 Tax=Katanobacteria TaxID=422282 RepID=A0A1F4X8G0_UNCKA|nr:MAG: 30S ribosomal protein S13 [candidate division WWE3 bacterium RIFOXYC1_FULL_39_7]OGC77938.1 MAG: 30S ribosomal protein S13 [candidate division WWE3 bacterium RIFOXYD1_FULL_39_9]
MARLAGIDIPNEKRVEIALTYVKGIGLTTSRKILSKAGVDANTRVKDLSDTDLASIQSTIVQSEVPVEGELRRMVSQNVRRLQENGSYRGTRHKVGLPVRGQRTRSNSRTRKGKRKTVGGQKKKLAKK